MKKIIIIDCGSSKVPQIKKMCEVAGAQTQIFQLNTLKKLSHANGIIISGAPILLTQTEHTQYVEKAKIIFSNSNLPVLGICFGHQLMGIYHGAKIGLCKEDRDWQTIRFTQPFKLHKQMIKEMVYKEDHCECISLPKDFVICGESEICINEAMQHIINPWFGVQFHPEVSDEQGQDLIRNFINLCTEK